MGLRKKTDPFAEALGSEAQNKEKVLVAKLRLDLE